jgi:hypothetical protein
VRRKLGKSQGRPDETRLGLSRFENPVLRPGKVQVAHLSIRDPTRSPQDGPLHDAGDRQNRKPPVFVSTLSAAFKGGAWLSAQWGRRNTVEDSLVVWNVICSSLKGCCDKTSKS